MPGVLLSLIVPFVVSIALLWVSMRAGKEPRTRSISKFTVKSPRVYMNLFRFLSPIPALIGLLLFLVFRDAAETEVYFFLGSLSGAFLLILLAAALSRLDVNGDILAYRSVIGRKKSASLSQIDKVVIAKQSTIIYANGKRFGSLSNDCLHIDNFHRYCQEKGIPIM